MLPKFIEDCNLLLPDGAADSARCMGLCAHCTQCVSPARDCLQMIQRNSGLLTIQIWTPCRYHVLGAMHETKLFEIFIRSQKQFPN